MSHQSVRPAVLCVCDGWGCSPRSEGNAIAQARTPNFDGLRRRWPQTSLAASGTAVGLPPGQQGNSEVGHLTIGAGRVVLQDLTRIDRAVEDGTFFDNPVLRGAVELALQRQSRLHLLGLVSEGGVHSHQRHLVALCELARRMGLGRVSVHAFMDGRDTPPQSGRAALEKVLGELERLGTGALASLGGRYFAMDRDRHWERTAQAWEAIRGRTPQRLSNPLQYLEDQYAQGVGDEFIPPAAVLAPGDDPGCLEPGDVAVHFNFRPDRARQLCHALADPQFKEFDRGGSPELAQLVTFTRFDDTLRAEVAFPKPLVKDTLSEVVSRAGLRQFHVAETEKYAHVTYFLNGGREQELAGEERLLVPSSRVSTYDEMPEMSAAAITGAVLQALRGSEFPLIVLNYANADMVGHTGDLGATVRAVEFLDGCIGELAGASAAADYLLVLTADHGNAELKVDPSDGSPLTQHTTSRVPLILANGEPGGQLHSKGGLSDVAPTLLAAMGLTIPSEMTGVDLRQVGRG
ncbi:MAG: 2,3-bisphosphoglycerate-independent phosphoglycerate mutase [Candidatus Dormibacteria bacterium]